MKSQGGPDKKLDKEQGPEHDLLKNEGPYAGLLRAAFEGKLLAVVGGPNCRTRSVLRHRPIEGQPDAPRSVRSWNGGEHGAACPIDQVRLLREKYLISYFLSNSQDANRICITYR